MKAFKVRMTGWFRVIRVIRENILCSIWFRLLVPGIGGDGRGGPDFGPEIRLNHCHSPLGLGT